MMIQRGNTSVSNTSNLTNEANHFINFKGAVIETTVTSRDLVVESWIRDIYATHSGTRIIVALDYKGEPYGEGILQMCVDRKCLILQISHMKVIPGILQKFLEDTKVMFIAVDIMSLLSNTMSYSGKSINCSRAVEVINLATENYIEANITSCKFSNPGLEYLAKRVLGFGIEKPNFVIESDWGASELFVEQIRYASIDAYAIYKIGQKLLSTNY